MLRKLYWLFAAALVWAIVAHSRELEQVAATLRTGRAAWIAAAVVAQIAYYLVFAGLYQTAFAALGVRGRIRDLLPPLFASLFVNLVAPSAGAGGAAVLVDDAARRGESAPRAAAGTLLALVIDLTVFFIVLVPGLWYLAARHDLRAYEVAAAVALVGVTGILSGVLLLGLWRPHAVHRVLRWVHRAVLRAAASFKRASPLPDGWADRIAGELAQAGGALAAHPAALALPAAAALGAHLLDVVTLYAIVEAYHGPATIGLAVAAYGVAVLFWIVAITPQGVGVVEGALTVTLASLGIPLARAAAIALAFRALSFWLPMIVGFLLLRRLQSASSPRLRVGAWPVHAIAVLTGAAGALDVALGLRPQIGDRMRAVIELLPLVPRHTAHLAAVLSGFGLLGLAGNLWRRKHTAWVLALLLLSVSAAVLWLREFHQAAAFAAVLAVALGALRPHFHARSDPPSTRQGVWALLTAALVTLAYGMAGFYVLDRHFRVEYSLVSALRQSVLMFTEFSDPGLEPVTGFGRYFADSIYLLAAASFLYAAVKITRPVLLRHASNAAERAAAARIVQAHGRSSLARLTLLEDKAYYFSAGGSVVAYAVAGRTAVALGDPIGPEDDVRDCVAGFADACRRNDWLPAFYQTLPDHLDVYRAAGFQALCVGHEAIVDLATFTLHGGAMKEVRGAVNRLTRLGYRTVLYQPPIPEGILAECRAISDEWLAAMRGTEKRFSLGWFDDGYIRDGPVMAVCASDGTLVAFANIISEYQAAERTIDLMRRRQSAESGTMDFLFVALFEWARSGGAETFNLGLSPLAGVGELAGDPAVERAVRYIYEHLNRFYSFKGLHRFKQKFGPHWSPRYLIYPGGSSLLPAALAVIRADAGRAPISAYTRLMLGRLRRDGSRAAAG